MITIPTKTISTDQVSKLLPTTEFARRAGISMRTVQQLCDEGKIKFRRMTPKPESRYLIPESELSKFGINAENQ